MSAWGHPGVGWRRETSLLRERATARAAVWAAPQVQKCQVYAGVSFPREVHRSPLLTGDQMLPPHLPERRRRVPRVANLGAADRASSFSFTLGARAAQSNPNQIRGTIDAVARSMDAVGASGGGNRGGTAEVTQRNMEDLLRDEFTGGDPLTRSMRYTPVRPTRKLFCHGSSLLVQNLKAHTDESM